MASTPRRSLFGALRSRLTGFDDLTSQPRPDHVDTLPSSGLEMTDPFTRPPAGAVEQAVAGPPTLNSIIDGDPAPRPAATVAAVASQAAASDVSRWEASDAFTAPGPLSAPGGLTVPGALHSAPAPLHTGMGHAHDGPWPTRPRAAAPRHERRVPLSAAGHPDFAQTQMAEGHERSIGDLLIETGDLSADQVAQVLAHQQAHGTRFGESAVQLGLVRGESVMWALSQQHQYAYLPGAAHSDLSDELVVAKHPFSEVAEAVRDARSALLAGVLDPDAKPRRALAITSPNVADGKTWFAANLAVSLSQLGARTLLIDADLRTPRLHDVFGLADDGPGLSTVLSGRVRASVMRPVRELKRLYLMPAGAVPPNPLELVQGPSFALLLRDLVGKFDHVILDTPAAEHGADCRVIAARCGAALAIGRRGRTQLDALQALVQQLGKGNMQFAGVVMNEV